MNKIIDFLKLGGYPMAQEDLDWLQGSYRGAFAELAKLIGDKTIISGMVEAGGNVGNGWISLNGELLPFIGGAIGTGNCIIEETKQSLTFLDTQVNEVLITRVARFGSPGTFNYADLVRTPTIKEMWQPGDIKKVKCDNAYITANFDVTGKGINKRTGWAICNGNNGTADLKGKFLVGYNPADADYDQVGKTGGEKQHILTVAEMPGHSHFTFNDNGDSYLGNTLSNNNYPVRRHGLGAGIGNTNYEYNIMGGNGVPNIGKTSNAGSGQPHENRPPYYVILFIEKL